LLAKNYVNGSIVNLKLGNTEVVAQKIKALLPDADMFQIDTTYEYSKWVGDKEMTDKEQIEALYRELYEAMVRKDTATLNRVHADDFVLTHMTGMHQSKQVYIRSIANGTLNYYSAEHETMEQRGPSSSLEWPSRDRGRRSQQTDIKVDGNHAILTGRSRVNAAVFGGGRHAWRLQLSFQLVKRNGRWQFTAASASTY